MQARYYDPEIGRFYVNDPVGFDNIHNFNRYTYGNNNPYRYTDPDGKSAVLVPEPSDAAWPKWAGYAVALAGAVAVDAVIDAVFNESSDGNSDYDPTSGLFVAKRNREDFMKQTVNRLKILT